MKSIFLSNGNSFIQQALINSLNADNYQLFIQFYSHTAVNPCMTGRSYKCIHSTNHEEVRNYLVSANIIIYELEEQDGNNTYETLQFINEYPYDKKKKFILISNMLTWYNTIEVEPPTNFKLHHGALSHALGPEYCFPKETKAVDPYMNQDKLVEDLYNTRKPHHNYAFWKDIEKLCAKLNSPTLETYCLFSGLVYGHGEHYLRPFFKQAWAVNPEGLPVFGNGYQRIPMIHTQDLVTIITTLVENTIDLDYRYIFAVDKGDHTWLDIVQAISSQLSYGNLHPISNSDALLCAHSEQYTVNLASGVSTTGPGILHGCQVGL